MKKSEKLLLSLISVSILAQGCSISNPISSIKGDRDNQEIEIFQNENRLDEKSDLSETIDYLQTFISNEEKSNSFGIKANGILEIRGNTKDVPRKVLFANNFKDNTAYRIEGSSQDKNAKIDLYKFDSKGWRFDSKRELNKPIDFIYNPKTFDFIGIAGIVHSDSKTASSYILSLKEQAVNKKIIDVPFISQNSLIDTLGLVEKYKKEKVINKPKENKRAIYSLSDLRNSACANTSAAMLLNHRKLNKEKNLNNEALRLYDIVGTDNRVGTSWTNLLSVLKNAYNFKNSYYIGWGQIDFNPTQAVKDRMFNIIVEEITANRPLIFRSHGIPGYAAHYILVVGFDKQKKTIITNDPGTLKGKNREFSFRTVVDKNAGILVVK